MQKLLFEIDFTKFLDGSRWASKRLWDVLTTLGMHSGDNFYKWISELLADKGIHTFGDIKSTDLVDLEIPKYRWRLKVTASDVTNGRLLTFPDDAILFNIKPDEFEVALAVRMSMSLPLFFKPVRLKLPNNSEAVIVDGGLLSSFPIWMYDSNTTPTWPTFGLLLKEDDFGEAHSTNNLTDFLFAILKTMLNANDKRFVRPEDYIHRTIAIPTGNISTTKFNLSTAEKQILYHSGYTSTNQFLENWSWQKYRSWSKKVRGIK